MLHELRELGTNIARSIPRAVLGMIIIALAWMAGRFIRTAVRRTVLRRREPGSLAIALGRLVVVGAIVLGSFIAATVVIPNFTPARMVGALGIGSVAIGFAFKDIFQNFLAGILILVTKPFVVNDQIAFGGYEGTVEHIETRATYLRTYDGRRVIIPNGELFVNSVTVNTAYAQRRIDYEIGIGFDDDIERARAIILEAMQQTEGVDPDPRADVIIVEIGETAAMLRARWWCGSRVGDVLVARDKVLTNIIHRLQAEGYALAKTNHVRLERSSS
jgi:small conductance mechanosensitive channel